MTRISPRPDVNKTRLVRLLNDLDIAETNGRRPSLAEGLEKFLNFSDAITLSTALDSANQKTLSSSQTLPDRAPGNAANVELLRVQRILVNSVVRSCTPGAGVTLIKLPSLNSDTPIESAPAYEPYQRFYLAHQRTIADTTRRLRADVRAAIAVHSPALAQLAALDAVFDDILWEKTRRIFSTVPKLLEKRFEQLFAQYGSDASSDPTQWLASGGWLWCFCQDMQALLLAEVDIQLQPALGLIEAFNKEVHKNP